MTKKTTGKLCVLMAMVLMTGAQAATPVHLDKKGEAWAQSTLRRMTTEEKVGQMIVVWARVQFLNVHSRELLQLREEMQRYHVGGFGVTIPSDGRLIRSAPLEAAYLTNGLQKRSKYPLIFAADFERGLSTRLAGTTGFPAAMAFGAAGDPELAKEFGRITAEESRAVGIQWNWFPVADVNSNPANPIINTRSFGEDPAKVSAMVAAYIGGARAAGLLTTVKHFPGHGDTDTDSHLSLARTTASMDRLNALELAPFRAAIAAGVDSVMIGHITVPAVEPDPDKPASISAHVVTGLLKEQMGFKGLVVTDALDMGALMHTFRGNDASISGQEAVEAVLAGNDMVIIPADLGGAYNGLLQAVRQGKLSRKRIDESVLKILRMKASVGLSKSRFVDASQVPEAIAQPGNLAIAQIIAERAVTLVEDKAGLVPVKAGEVSAAPGTRSGLTAVFFTDDARESEGARAFQRELRNREPGARILYVDGDNAAFVANDVMAAVGSAARVIAVAESFPSARRVTQGQAKGSAGLDRGPAEMLQEIVKAAPERTIVAAFGNPYTGDSIAGMETYVCTFSNSADSAVGLVSALFGETAIHGRLPVTLPGVAALGTGLDREIAVSR
jgi:beta-N-acetylhexosaminidase